MALHVALNFLNEGKYQKAARIYKYALRLDPKNIDALNAYAEFLELHKKDIVRAEHFYTKVVHIEPDNSKALLNLKRAGPLVSKIDRQMFNELDLLLKRFYDIPARNSALRRAKREAYFLHIYHSNAIEGNTLNLQQTRHIIETRMSVGGKSIMEHNEVLGLDAAMRFINHTLLYRPFGQFIVNDILEIHRRVLGFCDPIESGKFRKHQVYVGHFTPPHPRYVEDLMDDFIEWLNSKQLLNELHPIQIAALAHYKFVFIHPFYDGNGRTGRLLMNLILMKFGYPPIIILKEDRLDYYDYLEMANQGDIKPFIRFVAKCTQRTLKEFIRMCNDSYSISVDEEYKMHSGHQVDSKVLEKALFDFENAMKVLEDEADDDLKELEQAKNDVNSVTSEQQSSSFNQDKKC
jgi:Fic family protein